MNLRQFMLQTNAIGHVEHRAGDQMYIDFAGDRLDIVDESTAEVRKVEVFVAILLCGHCTYCEAVWSQKKEDLIKACENAFHFYGGAPCADSTGQPEIRSHSQRPQRTGDKCRPRRLPPPAPDSTEKIAITFMAIGCVLRHDRLSSQKFFVTLYK